MRFEPVFEKRVTRSIEDWLSQLGLARYADAFVAAEIDVDVLAELTDADLVSLGVTLGDRKRILRAGAGTKPAAAAIPEPRQSTVVYCDLVDATDLAVRLDPRELRAVMAAYHARCADVVAAHGGEAQYLGAGVMVAFGGGLGDAEVAERATRCALALLAAIGALCAGGMNLQTRIGVATGSEAGPETPSLAARLQRLAEPGSVLIADTTRRLLGAVFTFAPADDRAVTGLAERGEAWHVELPREPAPERATSTVADAAVVATAPQTPAEPPLSENHFEDGGEPFAALRHWQSELERADRQHDPRLRLEALHACWTIAFSIGDLSYTLDATARGVALYDAASIARQIPASAHDASVCAAGYRALALLLCGRIREGRGWLRRVETAIARLEHPPTRCMGQLAMATARDVLGEFDLAIALANEARKLAIKHRLVRSLSHAACISAAARIGMGDRIAGMRALELVLDEPDCALAAGWRPYYLVRLALARIDAGDDNAADVRLADAQTIARERGGCVAAAEIERATGALLRLRASPVHSATERFEGAMRLARAQLATLLELRAACDAYEYALSLSGDAATAASSQIRDVLGRIDGGEMTFDVRRARTLEQRAAATR